MTESTARADSFDPQVAAAPAFVWEIPQKPVAIHLSLDVVDRLERQVVESFRSLSSRGSEIGGLLLGRIDPGSPAVVTIEDYELVACEYSRGPLYRLSGADKEAFDAAIRRRASSSPAVVGYFRSNTRKGLSLDPEDILFLGERFNRPDNVLLLVRPFASKSSVAGFFFWEDGQIRSDASYLPFPFSRHELSTLALSAAAASGESSPPPLAGAVPAAPKVAARAQVVPIASRRDIALPVPPAVRHQQAEVPVLPEPVSAPAVASEISPPLPEQSSPPSIALPEMAPARYHSEASEPPVSAPASELAPPDSISAPSFGQNLQSPSAESRFLSVRNILLLSGAAVALLLFTLFVYPGLLVRHGAAPAPPADAANIALRVERDAGQLLLTWNREAQAVKTARRAVLSINDGPQHENIELDLAQLRNGSVAYSPVTSDVSFRLEVTGPDSRPQSEYVRVLGTKPSPMPPPGPVTPAAASVDAGAPADPSGALPVAAGEPVEQASSTPGGTVVTESLADRLKPAGPAPAGATVLEPPSVDHSGGHAAAGLPSAFSAGAPVPPPLAPPVAAAGSAPAVPAGKTGGNARIGGSVQDARLISRADPDYPPLARQAHVRGIVHLEAAIGKDGSVTGVTVLDGHPLLRQAAVDSVKKWRYTPTLLNGVPIESKARVQVGFSLGR